MRGFVIDASVALAWCFDDEAAAATRALSDRFEHERGEVPSLWYLELANALALGECNRRIKPARTSEFIALIGGLPIAIDEQTPNRSLSTVLDLARSERLSAYDASYLELTMRRGVPLATTDKIWRRWHGPREQPAYVYSRRFARSLSSKKEPFRSRPISANALDDVASGSDTNV